MKIQRRSLVDRFVDLDLLWQVLIAQALIWAIVVGIIAVAVR